MGNKIENSQVADRNSSIQNSENKTTISVKKIRTEAAIISFIVSVLSTIVASYVYDHYLK